jgi:hypothetical protein
MPRMNADLLAFNRGLVSPLALARVDVARTRLSAATMTNWVPKTQGAMRIKPGTKYLGSSDGDNPAAWIEFVAATTDTALVEITDGKLRVWVDDAPIARPVVSTSIANGTFASSSGWTDASSGGGMLAFGGSGLVLDARNVGGLAKCVREIAVGGGDLDVEHALAIDVARGAVTFRCGSSAGADDYVKEAVLGAGRHSLAFVPGGNFHLTFQSSQDIDTVVASIAIAAAGVMELAAPWTADDLANIRFDQSADVVFVNCTAVKQRKIERRGVGRSWSVVAFAPENGPFLPARSADVRLKVGATFGNTTLTADRQFFTASHVGALFRLFHNGQSGVYRLGRDDVVTDAIEMTGLGSGSDTAERRIKVSTTGTWSATITVQRSFDGPDIGFHDTSTTITANATTNIDDGDDNLTVWYRLKIKSGDHGSGTAVCSVTYNNGGRTGICRVTEFNSPTSVDVEVLSRFSSTDYSDNWQESAWSPARGFPSSVAIYEGRLWHAGGAQIFGSVSDDYENYLDETEGDAGPITRSIGRGPVDVVYFLMPLVRLIMGTAGSEIALRSSSFDEPLTPQNNSAKPVSTQGSANVRAIQIDTSGVFVQRSGKRVFSLQFDFGAGDYQSQELTLLVPELLDAGVVSLAIQRQPDTRMHFVLGDGRVAMLTYEEAEEVLCWSLIETDGAIEKAMVLPGVDEDQVYYHVRRTVDGNTRRYLEKWAYESECEGGALSWIADCAVKYAGAAATTIAGLDHLEGKQVVVWAGGADMTPDNAGGDRQLFTVTAGAITLSAPKTNVVVGLPYNADWQSTKLTYGAAAGTALAQMKRADHIGFILANVHNNGLFFGRDFAHLDPLPRLIENGGEANADRIFATFDQASMPFPGLWDSDSRICLRAKAPRPVTVMAAVPTIQTNDKL